MRKNLCLIPLAMLVLAACSNDNSGGGGSGSSSSSSSSGGSSSSSGGTGGQALAPFVLTLFASDTSDTALPTDLSTVTLDTSSQDATAYNSLFASGS